jgi:hypothetical protein
MLSHPLLFEPLLVSGQTLLFEFILPLILQFLLEILDLCLYLLLGFALWGEYHGF